MTAVHSIDGVQQMLAAQGYVSGRALSTVVFLSLKLGRPLFLEGEELDLKAMGEQTIGLRLASADRVAYYIPGCAEVPDWLLTRVADADLLLFDGTVWLDDEMRRTGTGQKTGGRMGHISMTGDQGSLARFAGLENCRKVFIHINNTNPVLQPDGPERAAVDAAGWTVAQDGMRLTL